MTCSRRGVESAPTYRRRRSVALDEAVGLAVILSGGNIDAATLRRVVTCEL